MAPPKTDPTTMSPPNAYSPYGADISKRPPASSFWSQATSDIGKILKWAGMGAAACAAYAMFTNFTGARGILYVLPKKVEAMHVDKYMSALLNELAQFRSFHTPAYDRVLLGIDRLFQLEDAIEMYGPREGDISVMKMHLETVDTGLVELCVNIRNPEQHIACREVVETIQRQLGLHNVNILMMTASLRTPGAG